MNKLPINIVVMSSWSFKEPLTHSYLLPYVRMMVELLPKGSKVWLQTSEKSHLKLQGAELPEKKLALAEDGIQWLPFDYVSFGLKALPGYARLILKLRKVIRNEGIDFLHPFAPGAGTTAVFVKMITGTKMVMDSWEPHAESMVESGVWKRTSLAFKVMWWAEKKIASQAVFLIASNRGMEKYAREKWNIVPVNIAYRPACVDLVKFDPKRFDKKQLRMEHGLADKIVLICTGKLDGMYMGDETFIFISSCYKIWGEKFHALLLSETSAEIITELARRNNVPDGSFSLKHVSYEDVSRYLAMADFAFNPQKPIPSKRFGTPVKDGEYWAMELPVVIHKEISEDSDLVLKESVGALLGDMTHEDNMRIISEIEQLIKDPETGSRCREVAIKHRNFDMALTAYRKVYLETVYSK